MFQNEDELLEHLELENTQLAPFSKRLLAFVVDDILVAIIVCIGFWQLIENNDIEALIHQINQALVAIMALKFTYQSLFTWHYGQTIGKMLTKTKTIDIYTLDTPSLGNSCLRSAVRGAFETLFYIGFLFFFLGILKQTLHDKFSKTIVITTS